MAVTAPTRIPAAVRRAASSVASTGSPEPLRMSTVAGAPCSDPSLQTVGGVGAGGVGSGGGVVGGVVVGVVVVDGVVAVTASELCGVCVSVVRVGVGVRASGTAGGGAGFAGGTVGSGSGVVVGSSGAGVP